MAADGRKPLVLSSSQLPPLHFAVRPTHITNIFASIKDICLL
jgi:hypothetical protein